MFPYCCCCCDNTKDINTRSIIRKNRLILNKTKSFDCNYKKLKYYKILSTQNLDYKCRLIV